MKRFLQCLSGAVAVTGLATLLITVTPRKAVSQSPAPVFVYNSNSSPVPVREMDEGFRKPWNGECLKLTGPGPKNEHCKIDFQEAGKRLVIEVISVNGSTPAFQHGVMHVGGQNIPMGERWFDGNREAFAGSMAARRYMNPGETMWCGLDRTADTGSTQYSCTLFGYLVDLPPSRQ